MAEEKALMTLYNSLRADNYDVPDNYEDFEYTLTQPGQDGVNARQTLYQSLKADNYDVPEDYADFANTLFVPTKPANVVDAVKTDNAAQANAGNAVKGAQTGAQIGGAAQKPAAQQPKQQGYKPTLKQKIAASMAIQGSLNQYNQWSRNLSESSHRMTERNTKKGRARAKAGEMAARMAGKPTETMGVTTAPSNGQQMQAQGNTTREQSANLSPQVMGTVVENGEQKVQWMLPDGTLTTDLVQVDTAEKAARTTRLEQQFNQRMVDNGLNPENWDDVKTQSLYDRTGMDKSIAEQWALMEEQEKQADETYLDKLKKLGKGIAGALDAAQVGPDGMPRGTAQQQLDMERAEQRHKNFDLEKIAENAYQNLPAEKKQSTLNAYASYYKQHPEELTGQLQGMNPEQAAEHSLRSEVYGAVYNKAVQSKLPKSNGEYFLRKMGEMQLLSPYQAANMGAAAQTGNFDLERVDAAALEQYGRDHKALSIAGTVAGMAIDPLTYVGGALGKGGQVFAGGAIKTAGKALGLDMTLDAGTRLASRTLEGRVLGGAAAGAINLGFYMGAKEGQRQMTTGGYLNPETGQYEGYSPYKVLEAGSHGVLMGTATGVIAPLVGNKADVWVKATTSTAGKVGIRAGELATSTVFEGTIFAIPEIYNAKTGADAWDAWTDSMAMMVGFKVSHGVKSGIKTIAETLAAEKSSRGLSFREKVRARLDAGGSALDFNKDERAELESAGYEGLIDLFGKDKQTGPKKGDGVVDVAAEYASPHPELDGYSQMEALMNDNSVSQATRAKAYYVLTGRMLPAATIMGYTTKTNEFGRVVVQATGPNGEVVTTRTFKNETAAAQEISKIARQAELNTIDMGEQIKNRATDAQILEEAINQVGNDINQKVYGESTNSYDFAQVSQEDYTGRVRAAVDAVKNGTATKEQRNLFNQVQQKAEELQSKYKAERPDAIREQLKKITGVDVDKALSKEPSKRSEAERQAIDDYLRQLYPEEVFNQAEKTETYSGQQITSGREQWAQGYTTEDQDQREQIVAEYEQAREALRQMFVDTGMPEDYVSGWMDGVENDPEEAIKQMNEGSYEWSPEQMQAVNAYVEAKQKYEGLQQRGSDDVEAKTAAAVQAIDERTNKQSGLVQSATLKVGDRKVYIVDGEVKTLDDGTIDMTNSSEFIIVKDAETGNTETVSPKDILNLGDAMDPATMKDEAAAAVVAENQVPEASEAVNGNVNDNGNDNGNDNDNGGEVTYNPGDTYTVDYNGEPHTIEIVESNGEGLHVTDNGEDIPAMPKAMLERLINGEPLDDENDNVNANADVNVNANDNVNEVAAIAEGFKEEPRDNNNVHQDGEVTKTTTNEDGVTTVNFNQYRQTKSGAVKRVTKGGLVIGRESILDTDLELDESKPIYLTELRYAKGADGKEVYAGTIINDGEEYEVKFGNDPTINASNAMPVDKKGNPVFSQVSPERGLEWLENESELEPEEVAEQIVLQRDAATKALEKAKKNPPKQTTDIAKYKADKAAYQKKLDEAQAAVDYWNKVKEMRDNKALAEQAARDEEQRQLTLQAQAEEAARIAEEQRKAEEQAALGNNAVAPVVRDKWTAAPKVEGAPNELVLPNGEKVEGRYMLVEAGAATASHDPANGFAKSEGYPVDENGQSVNDRDYERDKSAQEITRQIADRYDSRALQTPVVVSQDGVVLSGNGRTMAGDIAAAQGTDGDYIDYLKKYPQQYGFTPEQVAGMQHPRVVFVPNEPQQYNAETLAKYNQQEMKSQDKTEQAVKLGKVVDDATFGRILDNMNGFATLGEFYADQQASRDAIMELQKAGVFTQAQVAEMFDGDTLSPQGREMLENTLIGKAFESNPDAIREISEYKAMRQSIIQALAEITNNLRLGKEYSLEQQIADAIDLVYKARKHGYKAGEAVSPYARQGNLFQLDEGATAGDMNDATMLMLADVINDGRTTRLKNFLRSYNANAEAAAAGQLDLWTGTVKSRDEIITETNNIINGNNNEQATTAGAEQAGTDEPGVEGNAAAHRFTENEHSKQLEEEGRLTAEDKKTLDLLADVSGRAVRFADVDTIVKERGITAERAQGTPGYYNPTTGEVVLNTYYMGYNVADGTDAFVWTIGHELTHVIRDNKTPEGRKIWDAFVNFVRGAMGEEAWETAYNEVYERYRKNYRLDEKSEAEAFDEVAEEVCGNWVGTNGAKDQQALNETLEAAKKSGVDVKKIIDAVLSYINNIIGKINDLAKRVGLSETDAVRKMNAEAAKKVWEGMAKIHAAKESKKAEAGVKDAFTGERGARNMDRADGMDRMGNLEVAKEMRKAGKDERVIKVATGWETGKDGKWRYEVGDHLRSDETDVQEAEKEDLETKTIEYGKAEMLAVRYVDEFNKAMETSNAFTMSAQDEVALGVIANHRGAQQAYRAMSAEGKLHFLTMIQTYAVTPERIPNFKDDKYEPSLDNQVATMTVGDLYDPESPVMKAYPELADMRVMIRDVKDEGGHYDDTQKEIVVALGTPMDYKRGTIVHEVQHAIQRIEGFSRGDNPNRNAGKFDNDLAQAVREANSFVHHHGDDFVSAMKDGAGAIGWDRMPINDRAKQLLRDYVGKRRKVKAQDALRHLQDMWDTQVNQMKPIGHEAYMRNAGETEARNVSTRLDWDDEKRRVYLASESEDRPRDLQTVRYGEGYGISSQALPEGNAVEVVDDKKIVYKNGDIELNYNTLKEEQEEMRQVLIDGGFEDFEIDAIINQLNNVAEGYMEIAKQFPFMVEWSQRGQGKRPFFSSSVDYPANFDFSFNCVKKEAQNAVVHMLVNQGKGSSLGVVQMEAINAALKKHGLLRVCKGCFVEAKRKALRQSKEIADKWNVVAEAAGLTGTIGEENELNTEQRQILKELAEGKGLERVPTYTANKNESGIKADTVKKEAALMLANSRYAGVLDYTTLLDPTRLDQLIGKVGAPFVAFMSQGQYRGKPVLASVPFSLKGIDQDMMYQIFSTLELKDAGGARVFSASDADPVLFLDYQQMMVLLKAAHSMLQSYTKKPFFVDMFGESGAMINQSLLCDVWKGEKWHQEYLGLSDADYAHWLEQHAGLKPESHENPDSLVFNYNEESFPVEQAMANAVNPRYGGRVGNVIVGISDEMILKALDDPNIHMILGYHPSSADPMMRDIMNMNVSANYERGYHTHDKDGKAVSEARDDAKGMVITGKVFRIDKAIRKHGDARKAADAYLAWCKENDWEPMFSKFAFHPEYYQMLINFRAFDNDGKAVRPRPVSAKLPEDWQTRLAHHLGERAAQTEMISRIEQNEPLMRDIEAATRYGSMDTNEAEQFVGVLKDIYGKNNVHTLETEEFYQALDDNSEQGHAQKLRDNGGTVYGFAAGDHIYLCRELMNAHTPMHEHSHIYMKVLKIVNPKLHQRGVELFKSKEELWNKIKDRLEDQGSATTDDAVLSEIVAQHNGNLNEETVFRATGITDKKFIRTALDWLKELWNSVKSAFSKWSKKDLDALTADEFASMPTRAIYDEVERKQYKDAIKAVKGELNFTELNAEKGAAAEQPRTEPTDVDKANAFVKGTTPEQEMAKRLEEERFTKEESLILSKAKEAGIRGKAPNGKVSKLNRKQWAQIRTKNFKNFFGDFELASLFTQAQKAFAGNDDGVFRFIPEENFVDKVKKLTGRDIKTVTISASTSLHINKKHGKNEARVGQIDMTPEDIVTLPYMINNCDIVVPNNNYNTDVTEALTIVKRINGVAVIGTISLSKNKEAVVTAFKMVDMNVLKQKIKMGSAPGLNVLNASNLQILDALDAEHIANVQKDIQTIKQKVDKCSKIVDSNGEPLVAYHGTPNKFSQFDPDKIGDSTDPGFYGTGFYFDKTKDGASIYGDNIMPVYLSIKNPVDINELYSLSNFKDGKNANGATRWWYGLAKKFPGLDATYTNLNTGEEWTIQELKDYIDSKKDSETPFADAEEHFGIDDDLFETLDEYDINIPDEFTEAAKEAGYDGVINAGVDGNEIVAFYRNQIKSATGNNGDFSKENDDVYYATGQTRRAKDEAAEQDKEKQFEIIQRYNPADESLGDHTWIRSADEIKTYSEAVDEWDGDVAPDFTEADMQQALSSGKVKVYSSHPIENGAFVTPSKMQAQDYAGGGKVYEATVNTSDVAWIDASEGQYANSGLPSAAQDREYLEAVNSGDTERAAEMVRDAAAKAMPNTKVVDEDGKPMVVYHGSPATDISIFDIDRVGEHTGAYNDVAAWFTNNKGTADLFSHKFMPGSTSVTTRLGEAGKVYPVYLDMKKPFDMRKLADSKEMQDVLRSVLEDNSDGMFDSLMNGIRNGNHQYAKTFIDYGKLKGLGYDGIIARMYSDFNDNADKDAVEYGVFAPNQIKSAEAVTRDGEGNVIPLSERFNSEKDDIRWAAGQERQEKPVLSFEDAILQGLMDLERKNKDSREIRDNAVRAINNRISGLRSAMSAQKKYDKATVEALVNMTRLFMRNGLLDDAGRGVFNRLLAAIKNGVGQESLEHSADSMLNALVDARISSARASLEKALQRRAKRLDSSGVEIQGEIDINGVNYLDAFKNTVGLPTDKLDEKIAEMRNLLAGPDGELKDFAKEAYEAMMVARQYRENVKDAKEEIADMRQALVQARAEKKDGRITAAMYKALKKQIEDAIFDKKMDIQRSLYDIADQINTRMGESKQAAQDFLEREAQHAAYVQHLSNRDMQGRPNRESVPVTIAGRAANNPAVRTFMAPLANFPMILRMLGSKSVNGEGYLYDYFMRGVIDCTDKEWTNYKAVEAELDAKANEIAGVKHWSDLYSRTREKAGTVDWWDGDKIETHELTQGNLMYIYMASKMKDGMMKLHRMGILAERSEDPEHPDDPRLKTIDEVVEGLNPKLKALADWVQEEFLPKHRARYNEKHKEMFGAPMAAIENYVPLKILKNDLNEKVDTNMPAQDRLPGTITDNIIKRKFNLHALDILNADGVSLVLDHIQKMENWYAWAQMRRDMNTLLSYKRFKNQVKNINSLMFGSNEVLWKNVLDCFTLAAGQYRPKALEPNSTDRAINKFTKMVTASKIAFMPYTALKQLTSFPAYMAVCNPMYLAQTSNPYGAWKSWDWAIENLPTFAKRWQSRQGGNYLLQDIDSPTGYRIDRIRDKIGRWGMTPNAFVDGLTVAMGARALYMTRRDHYKALGYSEQDVDRKALQDAAVFFNETQQSSEGAFMSPFQASRTTIASVFSMFRNSPMGYTRKVFDAARNMKHFMELRSAKDRMDFMTKQIVRDLVGEDVAEGSDEWNQAYDKVKGEAFKEYAQAPMRAFLHLAIFGYGLQFLWNLMPNMIYLMTGDDDDEKWDIVKEAAGHAFWGSIEGLTGGNLISDYGNMLLQGQEFSKANFTVSPFMSDLQSIYNHVQQDKWQAANDIINMLFSASVGVNPQALEGPFLAIWDYCNGDPRITHELSVFYARLINMPQSGIEKLWIDELGCYGDEAQRLPLDEVAKRYAAYKFRRGSFFTDKFYDDEEREQMEMKQRQRFAKAARERLYKTGFEPIDEAFEELEEQMKPIKAKRDRIAEMKNAGKDGNFKAEAQAFFKTNDAKTLQIYTKAKSKINQLENRALYTRDLNEYMECKARATQIKQRMFAMLDKINSGQKPDPEDVKLIMGYDPRERYQQMLNNSAEQEQEEEDTNFVEDLLEDLPWESEEE